MNDDVYVAPQFRQAVHEFPLGDPAKLAPQDLRQLRLRHTKYVCSPGLGVALLPEDLGDLCDELGLDEHALGNVDAKVGIDVSSARIMAGPCFTLAAPLHCFALLAIASAVRSRSLLDDLHDTRVPESSQDPGIGMPAAGLRDRLDYIHIGLARNSIGGKCLAANAGQQ
jgi:hypothetical protein